MSSSRVSPMSACPYDIIRLRAFDVSDAHARQDEGFSPSATTRCAADKDVCFEVYLADVCSLNCPILLLSRLQVCGTDAAREGERGQCGRQAKSQVSGKNLVFGLFADC